MTLRHRMALALAAVIALTGCTKALKVEKPATPEGWEYRFTPGATLRVVVTNPLDGKTRVQEGRFRSVTQETLILHNAEIALAEVSAVREIVPSEIVENSIVALVRLALMVVLANWMIDEVRGW